MELIDDLTSFFGGVDLDGRFFAAVVKPKNMAVDQMIFDREICAAGVKMFVRPFLKGSNPETPHVLIVEESPGVRTQSALLVPGLDFKLLFDESKEPLRN